jgi:hypothetical protein
MKLILLKSQVPFRAILVLVESTKTVPKLQDTVFSMISRKTPKPIQNPP